MTPDLQPLAAAISRISDPNVRANVLAEISTILAKADFDTTMLTKAESDQFAAGKRLAQVFNAQGRKA